MVDVPERYLTKRHKGLFVVGDVRVHCHFVFFLVVVVIGEICKRMAAEKER